MQQETLEVDGYRITFQAEWYGDDVFLQDCEMQLEKDGLSGKFVGESNTDMTVDATHVPGDVSEAGYLFQATQTLFKFRRTIEDGKVSIDGEVYENPYLTRQDLEDLDGTRFGIDEDTLGMVDVKTASEDADGLFIYMCSEKSEHGMTEYDLESFLVHLYRGGEMVGSFERGYF